MTESNATPAPANNGLRSEIKAALKRASAECASGTPDHVLADFLLASLTAFDAATRARDSWWGDKPVILARLSEPDVLRWHRPAAAGPATITCACDMQQRDVPGYDRHVQDALAATDTGVSS